MRDVLSISFSLACNRYPVGYLTLPKPKLVKLCFSPFRSVSKASSHNWSAPPHKQYMHILSYPTKIDCTESHKYNDWIELYRTECCMHNNLTRKVLHVLWHPFLSNTLPLSPSKRSPSDVTQSRFYIPKTKVDNVTHKIQTN